MSSHKNDSKKDIEIFHRINKLKAKAGLDTGNTTMGVIGIERIQRAQGQINEKEQEYPVEVQEILAKLQLTWEEFQDSKNEDDRPKFLDKIYNYSNNIKDLTAMYQHDLMTHFSLSLRDFCEKIDLGKQEHHIIVQAHLDVMWVTYEEKLRSDNTDKAEELKKIVAVAIQKYS